MFASGIATRQRLRTLVVEGSSNLLVSTDGRSRRGHWRATSRPVSTGVTGMSRGQQLAHVTGDLDVLTGFDDGFVVFFPNKIIYKLMIQ